MTPAEITASSDHAASGVVTNPNIGEAVSAPRAIFDLECIGADGEVKWTESVHNTVFTAGKLNVLDIVFGAVAKPAAWYLVLKGAGTEVAADTLASHASWSEQSAVYTSANRPTVAFGAASANGANGQITTSAPVAVVASAAGPTVITGCGLTQTQAKATNTGILYNAGDFSVSRSLVAGDTLNVSVTLTLT